MKKLLLFGASALAASCAFAQVASEPVNYTSQPFVLPGALINHVSPNGVWAGSEMYGALVIANLVEGTFDSFVPDDSGELEFYLGNGNSISNNGIFVGTEYSAGAPEYYENGEWIILPTKDTDNLQLECLSNGITPDGSAIVGTVGRGVMSYDSDSQMAFPAIWNRNSNDRYDMYIELPAPATDLMGQIPQRVTAINISADGKTIAGQIVDNTGMMIQPIIFKMDDEGNWAYKLPCNKLYHPDITLPPNPGEGPVMPQLEDYMTAEAYEEYQLDVTDFFNGLKPDYPEATDYMTDAKAEEWEKAMATYEVENEKFMEKLTVYYDALDQYRAAMPLLSMNSSFLSPNGRYLLSSIQKGTFFSPENYPVLIDLEEDTLVISEIEGLATYVDDNGVVMAATSVVGSARNAWVSEDKFASSTPLQDYIKAKNEAVYNFMNENMRHDYESYDPVTWDPIIVENEWITGTAVANADMSLIITWTDNIWDFDEEAPYFFSYILPLDYEEGGLRNINDAVSALAVSGEGHGVVTINGQADRLEVYDAQGRLVFRRNAPDARVSTNLPSGIYMLKVYGNNGNSASAKAAL